MENSKFRVLLLDTKGSNPNHYICIAIQHALQSLPFVELVIKANLHDAVAKAADSNCNLLFAFDGEELDREICRRLVAICGLSVLWVTEDPYEISKNVANAALFDLVFTNDSSSVSQYGAKGRHLPLAGAKDFHLHPVADHDQLRYDLFFAGTAWPNRVEFFRKVLEGEGKNLRAKIALPTNPHLPQVDIGMPASQLAWRTSPADFGRFVNSSLATVVLPRVFSASGGKEFAETPPPRLFEAALAGGVQLVQETLVEASKYFQPERDFLYFSSPRDFLDKLTALRSNPNLRRDIATSAQAIALERHCYEHRVKEVLDSVIEFCRVGEQKKEVVQARSSADKPRLLFVIHNLRRNGNFGGVEVYVEQVSERLRDQYEIFCYVPKEKADSTRTLLIDANGNVVKQFNFSTPTSEWAASCPEREAAFSSLLSEFGISLVHFQHLIGHVPSLVHIAKSLGVATVLTAHDYYAICHNFLLLSFKRTYCHPDEIPLSQCDTCLWHTHHVLPGSQGTRRTLWNRVLGSVDLLVFNTQGALDLMSRIYPSVARHKNARVIPVPIEADKVASSSQERLPDPSEPLKVAVLGNFTYHKGGSVIARALPLLEGLNIEFHIFGSVAPEYAWLRNTTALKNVFVHGGYHPNQLPPALAKCDVSLHLSIWPETYCLTLSEAWQTGLVPIVTDIGALGERVTNGVNGLKIAVDSEGELVQSIRMLAEDRKLLATLQFGIKSAPISYIDQHTVDLVQAYESIEIKALRDLSGDSSPRMSTLQSIGISIVKTNWTEGVAEETKRPLTSWPTLILKAARHYRHQGFKSTAKASLRFIRSRI
jgi:glycosyltransferase involved in cell wall biosynthesis/spore maturation protein CgeB